MSIRAGVLILGSLYWNNADREQWRRERLDIAAAQKVWLPIRYGRLSGEQRGHTHTMMLSRLCYAHRELGVAYGVHAAIQSEVQTTFSRKLTSSQLPSDSISGLGALLAC
jgi:hypothetical protein